MSYDQGQLSTSYWATLDARRNPQARSDRGLGDLYIYREREYDPTSVLQIDWISNDHRPQSGLIHTGTLSLRSGLIPEVVEPIQFHPLPEGILPKSVHIVIEAPLIPELAGTLPGQLMRYDPVKDKNVPLIKWGIPGGLKERLKEWYKALQLLANWYPAAAPILQQMAGGVQNVPQYRRLLEEWVLQMRHVEGAGVQWVYAQIYNGVEQALAIPRNSANYQRAVEQLLGLLEPVIGDIQSRTDAMIILVLLPGGIDAGNPLANRLAHVAHQLRAIAMRDRPADAPANNEVMAKQQAAIGERINVAEG